MFTYYPQVYSANSKDPKNPWHYTNNGGLAIFREDTGNIKDTHSFTTYYNNIKKVKIVPFM